MDSIRKGEKPHPISDLSDDSNPDISPDMIVDNRDHIQDDLDNLTSDSPDIRDEWTCPECGSSTKADGKPFSSWASLRAHLMRSHKLKMTEDEYHSMMDDEGDIPTPHSKDGYEDDCYDYDKPSVPRRPRLREVTPSSDLSTREMFDEILHKVRIGGIKKERLLAQVDRMPKTYTARWSFLEQKMKSFDFTDQQMEWVFDEYRRRMNEEAPDLILEDYEMTPLEEYRARTSRSGGRVRFGGYGFDEDEERRRIRREEQERADLEAENRELRRRPSKEEVDDLRFRQFERMMEEKEKHWKEMFQRMERENDRDRQHQREMADRDLRIAELNKAADDKEMMFFDKGITLVSKQLDKMGQKFDKLVEVAAATGRQASQAPQMSRRFGDDSQQIADILPEEYVTEGRINYDE